mmetsp:Transcript_117953/g.328664  ORF Transcript_117953/g.328664 Transcript_117953/m.328664 type:complete len:750 (+) Transcript_117953:40-2289(+)
MVFYDEGSDAQGDTSYGGPAVVYVSGAGWDKANGVYLPIAQHHGTKVYENAYRFLLSREIDDGDQGRCNSVGWILGLGGNPLYAIGTQSLTPPEDGWHAIKGWGKEPLPRIKAARDVSEAVLGEIYTQLPVAGAALAAEDWDSALGIWRHSLDQLSHLLDSEEPEIFNLQRILRSEIAQVPLKQARAKQREAQKAWEEGDWQHASDAYKDACSMLTGMSGPEAAALRSELQSVQAMLPQQKVEKTWSDVHAAFDSGDWEGVEAKLGMVEYYIRDAASRGLHFEQIQRDSAELREMCSIHRVDDAICMGKNFVEMQNFDIADTHFSEALCILATLEGDAAFLKKQEVHGLRGSIAVRSADAFLTEVELAVKREDWVKADENLEAVQAALKPFQGELVVDANSRLSGMLRNVAEKKIAAVQKMGDEAAEQQDWSEADACWAEALEMIESSESLRAASKSIREELMEKRSWRACTRATDLMRRGDISRLNDNIFDAEEMYTEALGWLASLPGVGSLRCRVHAKRADVRYRKWQYKQAVDDCTFVLQNSTDSNVRYSVLLLAANASRAIHEQLTEELGSKGAERYHQMEIAVTFLDDAVKLDVENSELQRELRAWKRELPVWPKPVPMPPFDWSKVPRADKANYFGKVERRIGFSDQEIEDIWSALKKEPKEIIGPEDPEFYGYDASTALPKQKLPRHISRRTFYHLMKYLSGDVEDEEFKALWAEADTDGDDLLSFEEFAGVMRFDGKGTWG